MANRTVNIFYSVRINGDHKRLKPVIGKNNKIKPGWAILNGVDTDLPNGSYCIGWYEGSRRVFRNAGVAPQDAVEAAERQRLFLDAARVGIPIQKDESVSPALSTAIHTYLEEYRLSRDEESYDLVKHTLDSFQKFSRRIYLKDVTRLDLLKFADWLQKGHNGKKGNGPRTANNKFMRVHQFLKTNDIELVTQKDAPRYVEEKPEVYSQEDMDKFFAECTPTQKVIFRTFEMAGLRMQELMFLTWRDVSFVPPYLAVTAKQEYDFVPKAYHERRVVIPPELRDLLEEHQKSVGPVKANVLVFPTKGGHPNNKLLQTCKRIAKRAGLNCGHCDTCVGPQKECRDWFLHKFRATFATRLLQGGLDIESVREQMGHKDTESISRYLAPLKGKAMEKKINEIWAKKPVSVRLGTNTVQLDTKIIYSEE